jgi:hypothetical protein
MTHKLKVAFDVPEDHWIRLRVEHGPEVFDDSISSAAGDCMTSLAEALSTVSVAPGEYVVDLPLEPAVVKLTLSRSEDSDAVRLALQLVPGLGKSRHRSETLVDCSVELTHLCLTFWRVFRSLEGRVSAEAYQRGWGYAFPRRSVDNLGKRCRKP